jgi:MoaA/NifB/PqqE/SkfB family radical SAM enzyme
MEKIFKNKCSKKMEKNDIRAIIKLDYYCNSSCLFCHREKEKGREKEFSVEKKIEEAKKLGITTIEISGGEPTINREILNVLYKIKKAGMSTGIVSNGRMFSYKNFLKKVVALDVNFFFISFHSHRKEVHDFLTRTKNSWEQTVRGIENILADKKKIDLVVNCVVVKPNIEELKELVFFLKKKKVKKIKFSFPLFMGEIKNHKQIIPSPEYAGEKISEAMDFCAKNNIECFYDGLPYCLIHKKYRFKNQTIEDANIYYIFEPTEKNFEKTRSKKKYKEILCMECSYFSSCVYYNGKKIPFFPKSIVEKVPSTIIFKKAKKEFINHPRSIFLREESEGIYFADNKFFKIKDIEKIKNKERIFYKKNGELLLMEKDKCNNFKISRSIDSKEETRAVKRIINSINGNVLFLGRKDFCQENFFDSNMIDKKVTKIFIEEKINKKNINNTSLQYVSFFNYIVLFESYNQIKDLIGTLLRIGSMLEKNGRLVIVERNLIGILQTDVKKESLNYRNQTIKEACFLIESLGFEIKRKKEQKSLWEIIAEKKSV